ncbi:hypothetical protein jaqu_40260 [Jannaschia aquimarina]|uniref:Sulfotransferase family protein n=2 Tax=Jannaschia aquimarina TaxID=935700 RepID=A0A0D1CHR3_9RHOB|nr:hypothetical protein jaqu_40260 [Jannaschia aquimarina]SNS48787.1 hypothetical protein SAMN05421775_101146 [Jannaschia aquimarina]
MMYSFAARPDVDAVDEPFYAAFLARSGLEHPMREVVLSAQPTDPAEVAAGLAREGARHSYQKHMAHHMEGMPLDWAGGCVHIHLIRHPARVIASYAAKRENPTESDLGFAAQATLYDRLGGVVVDTSLLRENPRAMLEALCAEIGLPWDDAMLRWKVGPKPYDGAWAPHWYGSVHRSTGFAWPEGPLPEVARDDLLRAAMPFYRAMAARALRP